MNRRGFLAFAIIATLSVCAGALAQTRSPEGRPEAGRALALVACTGCHVVVPDQPFKPIYTGLPHPPDFREVANRPNLTATSLLHHLQTLPAVPQNSHMANPVLSQEELASVVAFIIGLRDKPVPSAQ